MIVLNQELEVLVNLHRKPRGILCMGEGNTVQLQIVAERDTRAFTALNNNIRSSLQMETITHVQSSRHINSRHSHQKKSTTIRTGANFEQGFQRVNIKGVQNKEFHLPRAKLYFSISGPY
jgi:hypothetical protein